MVWIVLGAGTVLLYAGVGAWMARVARRQPDLLFDIGRYGRMRRRNVTADECVRRHVPWGLGTGVLLVVVGALTLEFQRR